LKDEQSENENSRHSHIATWKRETLQRIFDSRKENDAEWIIITSSKWVLLQRLDPEDKVDRSM
jgi:hypothetical protein